MKLKKSDASSFEWSHKLKPRLKIVMRIMK